MPQGVTPLLRADHPQHGFVVGDRGPFRTDVLPIATPRDAVWEITHFLAVAIAANLRCVATLADPEGPHQLRVSLRRLRIALRTFAPMMGVDAAKRFAWLARDLGAIVGELRDADVMIEEMIRPAAEQMGRGAGLLSALDMWRDGVRARVRHGLLAARAPVFAAELRRMYEHREEPKAIGDSPFVAGALANTAVAAAMQRAVARGRRISELAPAGRHELRKDVKNWRYAVELAAAIAPEHRAAALIGPLKRLQSALGRLNDLTMLAQFDPPLPSDGQRKALRRVRKKILAANAEGADAALTDAEARWRWIERACVSSRARATRD